MKPAIAYVRVSTEGQATEGISLDAQRAKLEAWCTANDHTLGGVFCDAGLSGGRADNRPELQRALDAVCKSGGVLIVYSLSRLARSTKDTIAIAERLDKAGANLVSLSEKIDTTSAAGRMVFRLLAVLAEFERDLISERTSGALQHLRSQRKRVGKIPYGYSLAEDGESLMEVEVEQGVLKQILDARGRGLTFREICDDLMRRGIPAKEGSKWHPKVVMNLCKRKPLSLAAAKLAAMASPSNIGSHE